MSGVKGIGKQPEDTKAEDTTAEDAPIRALRLECVGSERGAGIHETIEGVGDDLSGLARNIELACADMTPLTAAAAASAAATASFITCAKEWSLITRANKGCVYVLMLLPRIGCCHCIHVTTLGIELQLLLLSAASASRGSVSCLSHMLALSVVALNSFQSAVAFGCRHCIHVTTLGIELQLLLLFASSASRGSVSFLSHFLALFLVALNSFQSAVALNCLEMTPKTTKRRPRLDPLGIHVTTDGFRPTLTFFPSASPACPSFDFWPGDLSLFLPDLVSLASCNARTCVLERACVVLISSTDCGVSNKASSCFSFSSWSTNPPQVEAEAASSAAVAPPDGTWALTRANFSADPHVTTLGSMRHSLLDTMTPPLVAIVVMVSWHNLAQTLGRDRSRTRALSRRSLYTP
jgi:hypothetical protein